MHQPSVAGVVTGRERRRARGRPGGAAMFKGGYLYSYLSPFIRIRDHMAALGIDYQIAEVGAPPLPPLAEQTCVHHLAARTETMCHRTGR